MPKFSESSLRHLEQCHPHLQQVAHEAIKHFDFKVICGHRGKAEQDKAFREKKSKVRWPDSKHNKNPSKAFDAVPVPLDWDDIDSFREMAAAMKDAAKRVHVSIRWGGDFKGFFDGPHFEI
jgi:hypothetical protein